MMYNYDRYKSTYDEINEGFIFQISFHRPFPRKKARTKDASVNRELIIMKDIKLKPCDVTDLWRMAWGRYGFQYQRFMWQTSQEKKPTQLSKCLDQA